MKKDKSRDHAAFSVLLVYPITTVLKPDLIYGPQSDIQTSEEQRPTIELKIKTTSKLTIVITFPYVEIQFTLLNMGTCL